MDGVTRRWPAYLVALVMLGYAVGKAVFAVRAQLGFPSGPVVSEAEEAGYFMDAATAQWFAAATGVAGAVLAVASVTSLGRKAPRKLMLLAMSVMVLGVGAGAGTMVLDGFIGIGVGWQWYHGVAGLVVIALLVAMFHSYVTATRQRVAD